MIKKLKAMVPERYKGPILAQMRPGSFPDLEPWRGRKKVLITLAGFYQNLGDMALTYAQKRFIEETLPDYDVLLVPSTDTYGRMKALKRVVGPADIITTIGGGNMDDVYPSLENARRFVVRSFPDNPIISFPQTIAFSDTPSGQRALRRSKRTYEGHPRLTIFAREPRSLEMMRSRLSGTHSESSPDIVLSLEKESAPRLRSGVLVSIRNDKEALLTANDRGKILEVLQDRFDDLVIRDTVDIAIEDCQPDTFERTLHEFWDLLSSRKVVVTDRLHAMIFCVLTRTPVIVLPNSNHKIKGTYDAWLSDHSSVRYLESFDRGSFSQAIDDLWNMSMEDITRSDIEPHFDPLRQALLAAAGRAS